MIHLKVVKHLCGFLKDKNPSDDRGFTPLHVAAGNGHIDIVKYLVQFLENKHPKTYETGSVFDNKTPLELAELWSYGTCIEKEAPVDFLMRRTEVAIFLLQFKGPGTMKHLLKAMKTYAKIQNMQIKK